MKRWQEKIAVLQGRLHIPGKEEKMKRWREKIAFLQGRIHRAGQPGAENDAEFAESLFDGASGAINSEEELAAEEAIDQAIEESLSDEEKVVASVVEESIAANNKQVCHVPTSGLANPSLPRPALRFVRDITYPDGIVISPGTVFSKIWRVRNDGPCDWPQGVSLASAGGDMLSDPAVCDPLPCLPAGEEAEISVQLHAPECCGRFVSYFKAQTAEQQSFGQRLWCNVVVADEGEDWHVVAESIDMANVPDIQAAKVDISLKVDDVVTTPVVDAATAAATVIASVTTTTAGTGTTTFTAATANQEERQPELSMLDTLRTRAGASVVDEATTATTSTIGPFTTTFTHAAQGGMDTDALLDEAYTVTFPSDEHTAQANEWESELRVLQDMGFADRAQLVPLLQQFCHAPSSSGAGANNAQGLQQVVGSLLADLC